MKDDQACDVVTTGEAAAILGVRSATVTSWIRAGKLRGERRRKCWVVAREDLLSLMPPTPCDAPPSP